MWGLVGNKCFMCTGKKYYRIFQIILNLAMIDFLTPWEESYDQPRQHIKKAETLICQQRSI